MRVSKSRSRSVKYCALSGETRTSPARMFRAMTIALTGSPWMCGLPSRWMSPCDRLALVGISITRTPRKRGHVAPAALADVGVVGAVEQRGDPDLEVHPRRHEQVRVAQPGTKLGRGWMKCGSSSPWPIAVAVPGRPGSRGRWRRRSSAWSPPSPVRAVRGRGGGEEREQERGGHQKSSCLWGPSPRPPAGRGGRWWRREGRGGASTARGGTRIRSARR